MADILRFLYLPVLAAVILALMHAYVGLQIVERGVVFAGLSLAQLAALGPAIAVMRGQPFHGHEAYLWSFAATTIGAAILTLGRGPAGNRIPQQAIVAVVYAVAAAGAILAFSRAAGGQEHLEEMLAGNILAVSRRRVFITCVLYAAVGAFHYLFRERFTTLLRRMHDDPAQRTGTRLWDFLFYGSVGLIVTWSVSLAGVLLVFTYLIVPPVAAMLFSKSIGTRLTIGWTMGALVSAIGVLLSFKLDLPTGATIVCTFGIALGLMAIVWAMRGKRLSS